MSDQYKYEIALVCLISSLVYFIAKNKIDVTEQIYDLIGSFQFNSKDIISKLNGYKGFVLKKLKELGSKDIEIDFLNSKIDFNRFSKSQ